MQLVLVAVVGVFVKLHQLMEGINNRLKDEVLECVCMCVSVCVCVSEWYV